MALATELKVWLPPGMQTSSFDLMLPQLGWIIMLHSKGGIRVYGCCSVFHELNIPVPAQKYLTSAEVSSFSVASPDSVSDPGGRF